MGSNRTFMELKYTSDRQFRYDIYCSNRTFMELKFGKLCFAKNK